MTCCDKAVDLGAPSGDLSALFRNGGDLSELKARAGGKDEWCAPGQPPLPCLVPPSFHVAYLNPPPPQPAAAAPPPL